MQQSSRLHVINHDLPAGITFRQIVSYLALHSCPPEFLSQIMIHHGTSQMNRVHRGMSFIQNLLFQGLSLWHNQSIIKPQCAFHILTETSNLWITLFYSSFDMAHAFIILLSSNDLTLHGGAEGDI
jgi:type IV secretory pathway VirB6-like protein